MPRGCFAGISVFLALGLVTTGSAAVVLDGYVDVRASAITTGLPLDLQTATWNLPPVTSSSVARTADAAHIDGEGHGTSSGYISFLDLSGGNQFSHVRLFAESLSLSLNAYNSRVVNSEGAGRTEAHLRFSISSPQMFVVSDDLQGLGNGAAMGDAGWQNFSFGRSNGFFGVTGLNAANGNGESFQRSLRIGSLVAGIHEATAFADVSAASNSTAPGASASAESNMSAFTDIRLLPQGTTISPTRPEVLNRTVFINDGVVNLPSMLPSDPYKLFVYGGNVNLPQMTSVSSNNLLGGSANLMVPTSGELRFAPYTRVDMEDQARLSLGPNGRLISEDSSGILGKGSSGILGTNSGNILAKGGGQPRPVPPGSTERGFDDSFFVDLGSQGALTAETSRSSLSVSANGMIGGTFTAGDPMQNYPIEILVAGTVAPGDQTFFEDFGDWDIHGNLTLSATSTAKFDIGGLIAGTEYDFVELHALGATPGSMTLNGNLVLSLPIGTNPILSNQTLQLVAAVGGVAGHFVNAPMGMRLTTQEGNASFVVTYDANGVYLSDYQAILRGDFDTDGDFDCADVDALVADIAGGFHTMSFDLNGDGFVDVADLTQWLANAGSANLPAGNPYLSGDANLDGSVDGQDFIAWNSHKFTNEPSWCHGDFTADGVIDGQDFVSWNTSKFRSSDRMAAVPEPTIVVWIFGLVVEAAIRRWSNGVRAVASPAPRPIVRRVNLTGADTRGATGSQFAGATLIHTILPDGHVIGFDLGPGQTLIVRDYDGNPAANPAANPPAPPIP